MLLLEFLFHSANFKEFLNQNELFYAKHKYTQQWSKVQIMRPMMKVYDGPTVNWAWPKEYGKVSAIEMIFS